MPGWAQGLLALAALALMLALVAAVLALRRVAQRAEAVLTIVEQELRPLIGQAHALIEDLRALTREASREFERVGEVTLRVAEVAGKLSRVASLVGGVARVGQLVGVAAGVRKGIDVFVQRLRREQGDHHE
jgi:uncharacterized protein YoxC